MSERYRPEQQAFEQAEQAKAAEQQALEDRISQAESPKTEAKPTLDASDAQAQEKNVQKFQGEFDGVKGMEGVANRASADNANPNDHNGAQHQIDVANTLGPDNVNAFESVYKSSKGDGRVDIVTADDIAVECKYSSDPVHPSEIKNAANQGLKSLDSRDYKRAVVVYNNGALNEEMRAYSNSLANSNIRICERSELNNVIKSMRAGG